MGYFWAFVLYSFLGFLLEVAFARLTGSPKRDRKCYLFLPLCPVYGLGALGVLVLPGWVAARWWLLWPAGGAVCTLAEYGVGLFYEKALGVRFWSYEGIAGNLGGYVCPLFSLFWGGLAVAGRRWLHPLAAPLLAAIPEGFAIPALAALTLDGFMTLALLSKHADPACLRWYDRGGRRLKAAPAPGWSRPGPAGGESPPPGR